MISDFRFVERFFDFCGRKLCLRLRKLGIFPLFLVEMILSGRPQKGLEMGSQLDVVSKPPRRVVFEKTPPLKRAGKHEKPDLRINPAFHKTSANHPRTFSYRLESTNYAHDVKNAIELAHKASRRPRYPLVSRRVLQEEAERRRLRRTGRAMRSQRVLVADHNNQLWMAKLLEKRMVRKSASNTEDLYIVRKLDTGRTPTKALRPPYGGLLAVRESAIEFNV